jgi:hypothetical protein
MEYYTGKDGLKHRAPLRLVDPEVGEIWEPDPASTGREIDAMDALVELFIGGEESGASGAASVDLLDEDDEPTPDHPAGASIEAIITGHLPVRGAVWVRAYAGRVAGDEARPVALVRTTPDRTCVELVGSSAEAEPVGDIATAIRAAACASGHWMLHFDELDQVGLMRDGLLDMVTVLSGADEPAIVSAYRLIKGMSEEGGASPRIGIAIVGADPSNTARACDRLVQATRQFLGVELVVRPHVARIGATATTPLGQSDRRYAPSEILSFIADPPPPPPPPAPETVVIAPPPAARADRPADEAVVAPGERPAPAGLIAELRPLGLPCPVAPAVELAIDPAGRLHLAAWWSPEAPGQLLKAGAWARVNLPLLAKVCPGLLETQDAPPRHLVCVDLGDAADLHGSDALVHLAMPAPRTATAGWVCGRVS